MIPSPVFKYVEVQPYRNPILSMCACVQRVRCMGFAVFPSIPPLYATYMEPGSLLIHATPTNYYSNGDTFITTTTMQHLSPFPPLLIFYSLPTLHTHNTTTPTHAYTHTQQRPGSGGGWESVERFGDGAVSTPVGETSLCEDLALDAAGCVVADSIVERPRGWTILRPLLASLDRAAAQRVGADRGGREWQRVVSFESVSRCFLFCFLSWRIEDGVVDRSPAAACPPPPRCCSAAFLGLCGGGSDGGDGGGVCGDGFKVSLLKQGWGWEC